MTELFYRSDAGTLATVLLIAAVLVMELSFRVGGIIAARRNAAARRHIDVLQTSMLGLLALLLGFSFSLAFDRHQARTDAVVDEANAIEGVWRLAATLPAPWDEDSRRELRAYTGFRVAEGRLALGRAEARAALFAAAAGAQDRLWRAAEAASTADPRAAATGRYLAALNTLGDGFGSHRAVLAQHVPGAVSGILCVALLLTAAMLGGGIGIQGFRPLPVTYLMLAVLAAMVFVIADIDQPRIGLVQVDQAPLRGVEAMLATPSDGT